MAEGRAWHAGGEARRAASVAALPLVALLSLPLVALLVASPPAELYAGIRHPLFAPALALSARTTAVSLALILLAGTPAAWWLAGRRTAWTRAVELLVDVPIVLPPAVVGIALLQAFGQRGLLRAPFALLDVRIPFTTVAVVLAQVTIATPFYVQAAAAAFRRLDADLLTVARTLGRSPRAVFFRVAVPLASPGLMGGAALAWARALGEFGATLLFAGNLPGVTQTMPLAIYMTLESDVRAALALALVLAAIALVLLLALRALPALLSHAQALPPTDGRRP